ncbi:ATP-binding protein [Nonomuraea gerenzanensis]|uniref:Methylcrotonyl-CoA carboxylase biotin-containing subunit n=1 Tax=Nonomuraea gerenzanensis TaxID=93944 RepID=A0A1M4EIV1_9ACTN|nr:biotin carboxylase N-terminal domain-containing protein [Nonomuraea gerenzanensis]UBU10455.1 ATP-grasp domain-containing protein [Nonomuraea gerenzanensis]SBO98851.1 Methylcrotonyl-CoA carboxylase biotin-containing subunit [Nonomuraea gerenzanensis]
MITRLLVANRGEIARRVFRTCRALGIATVAVFSDADADAPHVAEADLAVRLPGTSPAQTYLDVARILAACRAAGADAVHPGYGFLSESAHFAREVLAAGLVWVGPPPEAIAAMGVKIGAKRLMAEAGVPVLPSLDLATPEEFPLLVKASAGGGGRGMRVVREPGELAGAVESARREASAAFGDGTVFAEPLLERARHVEVQVLADRHGTVWALGERECSVQRRHQKVVEECPSPGVSDATRTLLYEAAVRAARTIGYVGAGTVEFLVKDDRVAFLEMNTRLQVEHPVTELVYGVDLVRLQLEVAEGAALPAGPPSPAGWAVEARLYAEDAAHVPQAGVLRRFEVPGEVRVDAGVESGSVVPPYYDALLAKVVAHGPTRAEAVRRLVSALRGARLHGLTTNRDLLVNILTNRDFVAGDTHTGFLDPDGPLHTSPTPPKDAHDQAGLAAALAMAALNRSRARVLPGLPSGWRNVRSQPRTITFEETGEVTHDPLPEGVTVVRADPYQVILEHHGLRRTYEITHYPGSVCVDHADGHAELTPVPRLPEPVEHLAPGSLLAPMPGNVLRVEVEPGDRVVKGQAILVLEAMKMEHRITAPAGGVVAAVHVEKGRQVDAGAVLAIIQEGDS